jgi:hypothetical protein
MKKILKLRLELTLEATCVVYSEKLAPKSYTTHGSKKDNQKLTIFMVKFYNHATDAASRAENAHF